MSIATAERAYKTANEASYRETLVSDKQLAAFAEALKQFEYHLGDVKEDDYWQVSLRRLKGYRFRMTSAPLAFNTVPNQEALLEVVEKLENCSHIYPQHGESARHVAQHVRNLIGREDNPLLEALLNEISKISKLGNEAKRTALLIKESRFVGETEKHLDDYPTLLRHLQVITPSQLRKAQFFDCLFICGPLRWLRDYEYVMTAPRAKHLHVIRYGFLGDGWKAETGFMSRTETDNVRAPLLKVIYIKQSQQPIDSEILSADEVLLPSIDWQRLVSKISPSTVDDDGRDETVKARLCVLENDHAIFLETDDRVLVIDTRSSQVRRVKVTELTRGLFVVTRERGSGDYIVPFANRVLGQEAETLRTKQQTWKTALRRSVNSSGIAHVKRQLKRWEAKTASEQNIRNWMSRSERKIRPRSKDDFRAIMLHLGLDDDIDDYWMAARRIGRAHLKAGRDMRRQLEQTLRNIAWETLEQRGEQTFPLAEYDTHLQAHRIVSIEPNTYEVPLSQVGEILSEDDV